jgi:hypothetical protein
LSACLTPEKHGLPSLLKPVVQHEEHGYNLQQQTYRSWFVPLKPLTMKQKPCRAGELVVAYQSKHLLPSKEREQISGTHFMLGDSTNTPALHL